MAKLDGFRLVANSAAWREEASGDVKKQKNMQVRPLKPSLTSPA
jgi:hypothetical protein